MIIRVLLAVVLIVVQVSPVDALGSKAIDTVEALLSQWRLSEAEHIVERVAKQDPDDADLHYLSGLIFFHRGAYAAAARELRTADTPACARRSQLADWIALAENAADTVKDYAVFRSDHFDIHTTRGKDELLAPFAAETLEAVRRRLGHDLGYLPHGRIRVEIFAKHLDLARVSPLTAAEIEQSGTIALCKYNRLMIVTPRALLRGYNWRDTLAHEYIHLTVSQMSHNAVPVWLQEGLAKFFETRWRQPTGKPPQLTPTQEHLLSQALAKRTLITWAEMHPSMAKLPDQRATTLAFAQVQTAIDFLAARVGISGLRSLIETLRQGHDVEQAIAAASGLSFRRFQREWKKSLRTRRLKRLPGLSPLRLEFGTAPSNEQEIQRVARKARRHLRLATMLRKRKLTHAAIVEYKKARRFVGPRDAFVANALARSYLETEGADKAIRTLLPVLEYYPELAGPQVTIATAYLRSGSREQAAAHFDVALRINPFNPAIHCGLAEALAENAAARHRTLCDQLAEK